MRGIVITLLVGLCLVTGACIARTQASGIGPAQEVSLRIFRRGTCRGGRCG